MMARGGSAVKAAPEFLTAKEIDALYDLMETVSSLLNDMGVTWMLIAGSALGAVRQNSILFCDDDLDIAVMEQDYDRVVSELPPLLEASGAGVFLKRGQTGRGFRPWDKIRPQSCSHLWLDIFVLRKYNSLDDIEKAMGGELEAKVSDEMTFPLYHYDSRMALSYWPREWLAEDELLPTRPMPFAQLMLPLPSRPVPYLLRSYGNKCFQEYPSNQHHTQWQKEFAARAAAKQTSSAEVSNNTVLPLGATVECPVSSSGITGADSPGVDGGPDAGSSPTTCYLRLQEHHYLPIMHSRRAKRITSSWCQAELQRYLVTEGFPFVLLPTSMDLEEASCCNVSINNSMMMPILSGTACAAAAV